MRLQWGLTWFNPWVGKIPWRKAWQPTPQYSCLENSHGQATVCPPGGLQPMGSHRVGHYWVIKHINIAAMNILVHIFGRHRHWFLCMWVSLFLFECVCMCVKNGSRLLYVLVRTTYRIWTCETMWASPFFFHFFMTRTITASSARWQWEGSWQNR